MEELEKTGLEDEFGYKYRNSFDDLIKRAESCNNVAKVNSFKIEAETLKMRYLKEITKEITKEIKKREQKQTKKMKLMEKEIQEEQQYHQLKYEKL